MFWKKFIFIVLRATVTFTIYYVFFYPRGFFLLFWLLLTFMFFNIIFSFYISPRNPLVIMPVIREVFIFVSHIISDIHYTFSTYNYIYFYCCVSLVVSIIFILLL